MVGWYRTDLIFLFLVLWESSAITNRRSIVKHNGNVRNFRHIGGSSTSFTDWEVGLRESVHQALLREGYQDLNLRERILRAPLIGKQDSATPFGDVAVLARGQLYALAGGNFAFVQDPYTNDCDECHNARKRRMCGAYQCEVWRPQHHERLLGLWNVKRLRHRSHNNYHYEIQYTISPLSSTITEAYVTRNGRYDYTIPGHVFVIRNDVNKNLATAFPEIHNKRIPHENFNPEILIAVDSNGNKFFLHSYPAFFTAFPVSPTYQQDYSTKDMREIDLYKKLIQALADKTSTTKKEEGPFKLSLNHLGDTTKPSREKYPTTTQSITPLTPAYVPVIAVPETKTTQPSIVPFTKPSLVSATTPTETKVQSTTTAEVPKIHKVTPSMKTMVHFFVPIGEELMTTKPMEKIPIITKPTRKTTTEESAAFLFPDFEKPTPEPKKISKPTKIIASASIDADFLFPKPTKIYDILASNQVPLPSATSLTTVTIRPWQILTTTTPITITPQLNSTIESTTTSSSTKVPLLTSTSVKPTKRSTSKFSKTTKKSTTISKSTEVPLLTFTSTKPTTRSTLQFPKPTLATSATTSEMKKQQLTSKFTKPMQFSTKLSKPTLLSKTTKPYSTTMKSSTNTVTKLSSLTPRMEKSLTTSPRFMMSTSRIIVPAPTSKIRRPVTTTSTFVRPSSTSQVTEAFSTTKMTQPQITRPKTTKASISMATQPEKELDTEKPSITKITESPITTANFTVPPTSTRSTSRITMPQYVTKSREFITQTTTTVFDHTEPQRTTEEAREATDTEFEIVPDMIPTEPMHIVTQNPLDNKAEQEQLPSPNKETKTTIPYFTTNYFDLEQTKKETINVTSTLTTTKITQVPTTTTAETNILIMLSTTKTVEDITEKVGMTTAVPKTTNILENMQIQEHTKEMIETSERQEETSQTTDPLLETTQKIDKDIIKTTQDISRMNDTTTEVFSITSTQPNLIFISTTIKPATKQISTTVKSKLTYGESMRSKTSTSNFLTDGESVNEPINVNPVHKDYNEDDIFGTTKLTKKPTMSTTSKPTESDLAIQLFNRKRRRKAKASSQIIFSNFYEASTASLPVETSSQENSNEPQLLTSQSVETSISFEVNKRKKMQSPTSTKATVDEVMRKDGYTVYKAEFPKQLNISTTENSKKIFNNLAIQLVNHARTIDYLSQMENKTSIKPKYKRRNYRPKYKINKTNEKEE